MIRSSWAVVAAVTALSVPAFAEDQSSIPSGQRPAAWRGTSHVVVDTPMHEFTNPGAEISPYIYLNRCSGGCTIIGGSINDARTNTSTIPSTGTHMVAEYRNAAGETGQAADAEWNQLVQCLKEVYSPFAVTVTDQMPQGASYTMAVIAGSPGNIGLSNDILGIAPLAGDCSAQDNVISFSFANHHGNNDRVNNLCWTAAQETAHALGLDHSFMFSDGTSACNDPMTYRTDCGGQRFFRNKPAQCGENEVRTCRCGGSQNSHLKIRNAYGPGESIIPPPTVVVNTPMSGGAAIEQQVVAFQAGSKRGVEKAELWLNGYKWAEVKGAAFGSTGQLNPANYSTRFPAGVPDGVIDIVVKAYDDLGAMTESATVTVTKGAPCASADTCAKGQQCEAGKCFWAPPTGKLGDSCDYAQFCESNICLETSDGGYCSQNCIVGVMDSCPMGFSCVAAGAGGACLPEDTGGGCCSVGGTDTVWVHGGLTLFVLGVALRRRRRKADRL